MKFMLLVYNDPEMLQAMPSAEFDSQMRGCLEHADELRQRGSLLDSQMLESPATARTVRVRKGRRMTLDGPFSETKEVLGGFNLIEARDIDEAVEIAAQFPWVASGSVEVRPVREIATVRQRVGASA